MINVLDKDYVSPIGIRPDDLSNTVPYGEGFYGYQNKENNLFPPPPSLAPIGGTIYFDERIAKEDFLALMRIAGIEDNYPKSYAIFAKESKEPLKDGYLRRARFVKSFGMEFLFKVAMNEVLEQELALSHGLWQFVQTEKECWGSEYIKETYNPKLQGLFGGTGYCTKEALHFGFSIENSYYGVYSVWSRAWLVTK